MPPPPRRSAHLTSSRVFQHATPLSLTLPNTLTQKCTCHTFRRWANKRPDVVFVVGAALYLIFSPAPSIRPKLRWADKQIKSVASCLHEPDRKSIWAAMLVSASSNHTSTPWQRVKGVRGRGWPALWTPRLPSLYQCALLISHFIYMHLHWKKNLLWKKSPLLTRARIARNNAKASLYFYLNVKLFQKKESSLPL